MQDGSSIRRAALAGATRRGELCLRPGRDQAVQARSRAAQATRVYGPVPPLPPDGAGPSDLVHDLANGGQEERCAHVPVNGGDASHAARACAAGVARLANIQSEIIANRPPVAGWGVMSFH